MYVHCLRTQNVKIFIHLIRMDCPNSGMELYGAIHHMEERSENGLRKHFTRIKKTTIIL